MEFLQHLKLLADFQILFVIYIIIYGISFGVRNTWIRLKSFLIIEDYHQNDLGKILDAVFIFSIVLLFII